MHHTRTAANETKATPAEWLTNALRLPDQSED
jgi:hypothetical protein